jgi:hypothetical protein
MKMMSTESITMPTSNYKIEDTIYEAILWSSKEISPANSKFQIESHILFGSIRKFLSIAKELG